MKILSILITLITFNAYSTAHSVVIEKDSKNLSETILQAEKECKNEIIAISRSINEHFISAKLDIVSVKDNSIKAICFGKTSL